MKSTPIDPAKDDVARTSDQSGDQQLHCPCGVDRFETVHTFTSPPPGETPFPRLGGEYRRELARCELCGHYVSRHTMASEGLYRGDYVDATYGDAAGLRANFERIIGLPPESSDNEGRVRRIRDYIEPRRKASELPAAGSALDIGAGLGVFPYRLKQAGWSVTALDPDPRAVEQAREVAGVDAVVGELPGPVDELGKFDLVTFNKVLEHVVDPIAMLASSRSLVAPGGVVYIELPDGESASRAAAGFGRQEFFFEHHHVFSPPSLALLARRAGFEVALLERLVEPSSKYTLRAFLEPTPSTVTKPDE